MRVTKGIGIMTPEIGKAYLMHFGGEWRGNAYVEGFAPFGTGRRVVVVAEIGRLWVTILSVPLLETAGLTLEDFERMRPEPLDYRPSRIRRRIIESRRRLKRLGLKSRLTKKCKRAVRNVLEAIGDTNGNGNGNGGYHVE